MLHPCRNVSLGFSSFSNVSKKLRPHVCDMNAFRELADVDSVVFREHTRRTNVAIALAICPPGPLFGFFLGLLMSQTWGFGPAKWSTGFPPILVCSA